MPGRLCIERENGLCVNGRAGVDGSARFRDVHERQESMFRSIVCRFLSAYECNRIWKKREEERDTYVRGMGG